MADDTLVRDPDELTDEERLARQRILMTAAAAAPTAPDLAPIGNAGLGGSLTPIAKPAKPTAEPGSIEETKNRLSEIQWEKENPWGTPANHPGVLGKIGHVAGTIGNIAGDVLAPGVMQRIPGTQLNRDATEKALETRLGEQQKEQSIEGLRKAQEENLTSEAEARKNPKPKLLPGDENVATDAQGNRYQRYELPDQSTTWVPEGTVPTIGPRSAPAATPGGALAPIGAPAPGATPLPVQPSAAPGALPAGSTVGKPAKTDDKETFVQKYLKDNALSDTAENRSKALDAYAAGGPIGADRASQLSQQVANVLKGTGIDAGGYKITEKSTKSEAAEALAAAQKAANEYRTANAPDRTQQRKDAHTMGYAVDPSGQLIYTNKAEADARGATFEEMKPDAVNKDRQALRQLNDIQKNISAYNKSLNAFTEAIPGDQTAAMRRILAGVNTSDVEKMGYLTMGAAMDMMEHGEVGKAWNDLTPQSRDALIGYLRAKGAMIAYNRVVSGSARTNKEALEVEWNNLPLPYVGSSVANPQMKAMQENLDQVNGGFPTNLPGMKTPQKVQEQTEGAPTGTVKQVAPGHYVEQ